MSYILVQIEDFNGVNLGDPGDAESPLLEVVQRALEEVGGNLNGGQVAPAPRVWPPFVAVIVETSPMPDELLRDRIEKVWDSIQTDNGPLPPFLQIHVNTQD